MGGVGGPDKIGEDGCVGDGCDFVSVRAIGAGEKNVLPIEVGEGLAVRGPGRGVAVGVSEFARRAAEKRHAPERAGGRIALSFNEKHIGTVGRKRGGNHVRRRRGNGPRFTAGNGEFGEGVGHFAAKVEIEAGTTRTEKLLGLAVVSELHVIGNLRGSDRAKEKSTQARRQRGE
jgi:hypothetical protein